MALKIEMTLKIKMGLGGALLRGVCHLVSFRPRGSPLVLAWPTVFSLNEKLIMYFFL
jgi:hypothetical protein